MTSLKSDRYLHREKKLAYSLDTLTCWIVGTVVKRADLLRYYSAPYSRTTLMRIKIHRKDI